MNFKIGDKVKVRSNLQIGELYNGYIFLTRMAEFKGKVVTIKDIISDKEYHIKEYNYIWTAEMFEDIPKTKDKLKSTKKTIEHIISGNKTIVIIHNEDGTYKKGIAQCCPEDEFNEQEGFKIAYDRALGLKYEVNLSNSKLDLSNIANNIGSPIKTAKDELQANQELWQQFLNGNLVIHCKNKDEFNKFLIYCENKEIIKSGLMCEYILFKNETCFKLEKKYNNIYYQSYSYYRHSYNNLKIIEYNELFNKNKEITDIQNDLYQCSDEALLAELESRFIYNKVILTFKNSMLKKELEQKHNL